MYIYLKNFGQGPGPANFTGPGLDLPMDSLMPLKKILIMKVMV